jgi:hypothetical protein
MQQLEAPRQFQQPPPPAHAAQFLPVLCREQVRQATALSLSQQPHHPIYQTPDLRGKTPEQVAWLLENEKRLKEQSEVAARRAARLAKNRAEREQVADFLSNHIVPGNTQQVGGVLMGGSPQDWQPSMTPTQHASGQQQPSDQSGVLGVFFAVPSNLPQAPSQVQGVHGISSRTTGVIQGPYKTQILQDGSEGVFGRLVFSGPQVPQAQTDVPVQLPDWQVTLNKRKRDGGEEEDRDARQKRQQS